MEQPLGTTTTEMLERTGAMAKVGGWGHGSADHADGAK